MPQEARWEDMFEHLKAKAASSAFSLTITGEAVPSAAQSKKRVAV